MRALKSASSSGEDGGDKGNADEEPKARVAGKKRLERADLKRVEDMVRVGMGNSVGKSSPNL